MKKALRHLGKAMFAIALAGSAYIALLSGVQSVAFSRSPKIENQSQLELKLSEEREKLKGKIGKNIVITARLITDKDSSPTAYARKIKEGEYEIVLSNLGASEHSLKHELYHIADGHIENKGHLAYFFHNEPQAEIYALTGLKP